MFDQISLDKSIDQHLYIQLYQTLKELIVAGKVEEHQKLPPIRQMAEKLGVNNVTVVNAYKLLEEEGLVLKKIGSGTFVAPQIQKVDWEEIVLDDEIDLMNQGQLSVKQNSISFATATPDPDLFPIHDVKQAINHVLDRDGGEVFGYQDSLGYQPLREAFCKYLMKKGIGCQVKHIQVVSGAQQGIDILAKALLNPGDVVFTEEPTYTGAISAFKSRGARIISIPIRKDGIDLEILQARLIEHKPKFLYLMTNFQNPTGYSYTDVKKRQLLELANQYNLTIVEDDSLSELYFTTEACRPLRAFQAVDKVVYIKSFSKIFLPGFRIAFMVLPEPIIGQVMAAKHTSDISSSGLIQRTFDLLLRQGLWEKHIEGMRQIYREKFELFILLLRDNLPKKVTYTVPEGGLNFWLALPEGASANYLYKKCLAEGVIIIPGSVFYPDMRLNNMFRLSIAAVEEAEMIRGVEILARVIREYLNDDDSDDTVVFTPLM